MDYVKDGKHIFIVFGTRPEAIKIAPVAHALAENGFRVSTVLFRQHGTMLDEALATFNIKPTHDLGIIFSDKALFDKNINIFKRLFNMAKGGFGFLKFLKLLRNERPDLLMVQGDTSTAFLTALISFYMRIPVAHIEAGLRTHDRSNPFPEETNRELICRLADLHFAPTEGAQKNLINEGVRNDSIFVTGNTAIDSVLTVLNKQKQNEKKKKEIDAKLNELGISSNGKRIILFTAHRRESFGEPLKEMLQAAKEIANRYSDVQIVCPIHPNPNVQRMTTEILGGVDNIILTNSIPYEVFITLIDRAYCILTDSGGIQEEASVLGKPVLVMRDSTERAEALGINTKLIGRKREDVINSTSQLLSDMQVYASMAKPHYAFGKGDAAILISKHINNYFGDGKKTRD